MNFDKLYRLICEMAKIRKKFHNFNDLPNTSPYGFWIYPTGEFYMVMDAHSHEEYGEEMIESNIRLLENYKDWKNAGKESMVEMNRSEWDFDDSASNFLWNHKYIRVVLDRTKPAYYWESYRNKIDNKQMQTLKDLAMFYDIPNIING